MVLFVNMAEKSWKIVKDEDSGGKPFLVVSGKKIGSIESVKPGEVGLMKVSISLSRIKYIVSHEIKHKKKDFGWKMVKRTVINIYIYKTQQQNTFSTIQCYIKV